MELLRDGRYAVYGRLGSGGQAETLAAVDRLAGGPVAVKRFRIRGANSWKDVELAEREARVLSRLRHPALPRYVDHFEEDGSLYLVMEQVEGASLATLRAQQHAFDEPTVLRFLRDASAVLEYLHGQHPPVIHRDIKPGNVVLRADGSFAFVDFGAVRDTLRPEGGSTVVGTFGYMAPEQFQGRAAPGSDVYSVGATAIALLTGMEPEQLPHRGLAIDVRAALGPRTAPELVHALERMLEPDPDRRANDLAPLLERLETTRHPRRERPAPPGRAAREPAAPAPAEERPRRRERHRRKREAKAEAREHRRRLHRQRRRARLGLRRPLPRALALLGLSILRWLLVLIFGRIVPRALTAVAARDATEAARLRARAETLESVLLSGVQQLRTRVLEGPGRIAPGADAAPGERFRVAPIDVEGEVVNEGATDESDAPPFDRAASPSPSRMRGGRR